MPLITGTTPKLTVNNPGKYQDPGSRNFQSTRASQRENKAACQISTGYTTLKGAKIPVPSNKICEVLLDEYMGVSHSNEWRKSDKTTKSKALFDRNQNLT